MKINLVETFTTPFVGFVRITAEDGSIGWGQVSTYHSDITCTVLHRQVAPYVPGQDTSVLDDLLDKDTSEVHALWLGTGRWFLLEEVHACEGHLHLVSKYGNEIAVPTGMGIMIPYK